MSAIPRKDLTLKAKSPKLRAMNRAITIIKGIIIQR
jgi:hypothetical protein